MIEPTYRAESSPVTPSSPQPYIPVQSQLRHVDTLAASEPPSDGQGFGKLCLDFLSACWEWIKYNLMFCFFDKEEETREKLIEELDKFVNRTPFGQNDLDQRPELENPKDFLTAFDALSKELQKGIIDEMILILKKIKFDLEKYKSHYKVATEAEAYQKLAENLLELPYDDLQDLTHDNKNFDSHIVVFEAIRALGLKLRSYESY